MKTMSNTKSYFLFETAELFVTLRKKHVDRGESRWWVAEVLTPDKLSLELNRFIRCECSTSPILCCFLFNMSVVYAPVNRKYVETKEFTRIIYPKQIACKTFRYCFINWINVKWKMSNFHLFPSITYFCIIYNKYGTFIHTISFLPIR